MFNSLSTFGSKYNSVCHSIEAGDLTTAEATLRELLCLPSDGQTRALLENDLGVLRWLAGDDAEAIVKFQKARELDAACDLAKCNHDWVTARLNATHPDRRPRHNVGDLPGDGTPRKLRIAILSLLFNWPSTGGGTIHTAESGRFLSDFGYEVRHVYAKFPDWGLGTVTEPPILPTTAAIEFDAASWSQNEIIRRFRMEVDEFHPDFVIITDSWSFKPLLAEAAQGYKFFLRLAAQECLCPLNNVRLLVDIQGRSTACPKQQLATPNDCRRCVVLNEGQSGWLHHHERELAGFGTEEYDLRLRKAFSDAEGILAVNPLIAVQVAPFARAVHVVPSGFDTRRFPYPQSRSKDVAEPVQLFFAGLISEYMKGFHVLLAACKALWASRRDFEVIVTADLAQGPDEEFLRYIGWQSQGDLPQKMQEADIVVFPTIAEEALGRSAVEAMGVGRPVIASRIGGLPFTVTDEVTGLLFDPENIVDLQSKITRLLDSPELRESMGQAGRRKFEREYTWEVILERHYLRLFGPPIVASSV